MDFQGRSVNCDITGSVFEDGVCSTPGLSPKCIKPLKCNYCSCPPQVDPGCGPNNAACAIPCPEESQGMGIMGILCRISSILVSLFLLFGLYLLFRKFGTKVPNKLSE
jgi:hypothetical protein